MGKEVNLKLIEQKKRTIISRKEKVKIYEKFITEQNKTIELLDKLELYIEQLENENSDIKKSNEELKKKYNALANSKLGDLTLQYWKWKRKGE